jgi:hypothetical protein
VTVVAGGPDRPGLALLPSEQQVRDLLGSLLGRNVDVQHAGAVPTGAADLWSTAVYVTDRQAVAALLLLDLPLSVGLGAALALVPPARAEEAVLLRVLPEELAENLYEVANVCGTLLHRAGAPRIGLGALHRPGIPLPLDAATALTAWRSRLDLAVQLRDYGSGRLSLIAT